jgi:hypothetical protein
LMNSLAIRWHLSPSSFCEKSAPRWMPDFGQSPTWRIQPPGWGTLQSTPVLN